MRKLLIIVVLSALMAACGRTENKKYVEVCDCSKLLIRVDSLKAALAATKINIPINADSSTWQMVSMKSIPNADAFISGWVNYPLVSHIQPQNTIPTQAFVVSANDLLHAVSDSVGISDVVFYLGLTGSDSSNYNLSLIYTPARSLPLSQDTDSLVEVIPNIKFISPNSDTVTKAMLFDNSVPCPYCIVQGPMQPNGTKIWTAASSFHLHRKKH